jgi:surface protein
MIAAQNLRYMFMSRIYFNQSLNSWNVSNVKNMSWMFGATSFNQRLDKWDTSNVERMDYMFHGINTFNQSLQTWDTSKVINMAHMFHYCTAFNQPLNSWDVSKVTNMSLMLNGATSFNQSLANWKLNPLVNAGNFLYNTALSCENYSKTLVGWADDPNTPNNINISLLSPLTYAANIIPKRNILINKGWILTGDAAGSCFLATSENTLKKSGGIYPNPVQDNIYVEDFSDVFDFKILDTAGRLLKSGKTDSDEINVSALPKGIYILQIISKDKMQSFKFIKK